MAGMVQPFKDRQEAGRILAARLLDRKGSGDLVLAVPRGGVVVGAQVALNLDLDMDVIVPRKLRAPGQPELAIGAVASWGDHQRIIDEQAVRYLGVSREYLEREIAEQLEEVNRRLLAYRGTSDPPEVAGRGVILVDDGVATGYTIRAGAIALRNLNARAVTLAVPVAPPDSLADLEPWFDDVVCVKTPSPFVAVGCWYLDFRQISDAEVITLLERVRTRRGTGKTPGQGPS